MLLRGQSSCGWLSSVLQSEMVDEFPSYLSSIFRRFHDEPKRLSDLNLSLRINSSSK